MWIPRIGLSEGLRQYTERQENPSSSTISLLISIPDEFEPPGGHHTHPKGSPFRRTRKLISIPHGLRKRTLMVTIPPGVEEGTRMRLKGLGTGR